MSRVKNRFFTVILVLIIVSMQIFNSVNADMIQQVEFKKEPETNIPSSYGNSNSINPDGSYHFLANFTIQIVFIGYSSVIDENYLESVLPVTINTVTENYELGFTQDYIIDYDFVYTSESYSDDVSLAIESDYLFTNTSKLNETALELQFFDGKARSIFLDQEGYAIDGAAMEDWFAANPYTAAPTNGFSLLVLNLTKYDDSSHSVEHWFEFDDDNIDSNQTIDWFRLEWDNELNSDTKFPYPGYDSNHGKTYILDPSAHNWFRKWYSLWFGGILPVDPYSYVTNDLDDIQNKVDLYTITGQTALVDYLFQWMDSIIQMMIEAPSPLGSDFFDEADTVSVQTLILNGDDYLNKPVENLEWVTNEDRLFDQLDDAMPFIDWQMDITFANLSEYPIIQQSFENNLVENISNYWIIDGSTVWEDLYNRRYQFFDLEAADVVITATILIRSDMTMQLSGLNFTGMGGSSNVICLKSRDRYFDFDGVTPKSGITDVLIHEIGHCLGFGHPAGASSYCRGTMTYYNTRHEFNWFYREGLRRRMVDIKYMKAYIDFQEDRSRFGAGPFIPDINNLLTEIEVLLDQTITTFNQMDYLQAITYISQAQEKLKELKLLRDLTFGKIRCIGNNSLGMAESIFIEGDIAYVTSGQQLLLLDISNPINPTLISSVEIPAYSMDVHVSGDFAYLALIQYGHCIVDVSDSANPELVLHNGESGFITDVFIEGNILFTASLDSETYNGGVRMYDISNPLNPILVNHLYAHYDVSRVTVLNDVVYLATRLDPSTTGILSIDISNPHQGINLDGLFDSSPSYVLELIAIGDRLYVSQLPNLGDNFLVIDISNSSDLTLIDGYMISDAIIGSYVTATHAFLVCITNGLIILDLPTLTEVGTLETNGQSWGVAVKDDFAFIADLSSVAIIDVSDKANPTEVSSYVTNPVSSNGFVITEDYAYIADQVRGIVIMDIIDPTSPTKEGYYELGDGVIEIQIDGNYLFATTYENQFIILDISNPISPVEVAAFNLTNSPNRFSLEGNYAFIATSSEFVILDLTIKSSPTVIGSCSTSVYTSNVYLSGDYAFLSCSDDGLQIVDVSDLTTPTVVATLDVWTNIFDVTVQDNYAIIGHNDGLTTVDITNPASPLVVANYSTVFVGKVSEFTKYDDLLFAATYEGGLHIYNISDPTRPVEIGYNETLQYVNDIDYTRGLIFVTNGRTGLWIFEHDLDNDLLYSTIEYEIGTDPFMWDTDGDGWSDYQEWLIGTDPLDPNDYPFGVNGLIIGGIILGSYTFGALVLVGTIIIRRKKRPS